MNRDEILNFLREYTKTHDVKNQYFREELELGDILAILKSPIPLENPSVLDWFWLYRILLFLPTTIIVCVLPVIAYFIFNGFSSLSLIVWLEQPQFPILLFLLYLCCAMLLSRILSTIVAIPVAFFASKKAKKRNIEMFTMYEEALRALPVLEKQLEEAKRNKK